MAAQRRSTWDILIIGAFLLVMLKTPEGKAQQTFHDLSTILLSLASEDDDSTAVFVPKDAAEALEERLVIQERLEEAHATPSLSYLPPADKQPSASARSASSPVSPQGGGSSSLYSISRNRAPLSLTPQGNTKGYNHDVGPHGSRFGQGGSAPGSSVGPQRGDSGIVNRPGGSVNYGQSASRGNSYSTSGTGNLPNPQQSDIQVPESGDAYNSQGSPSFGGSGPSSQYDSKQIDGHGAQVSNNYGSQGSTTYGGSDSTRYAPKPIDVQPQPKPIDVQPQRGYPGGNSYTSQVTTTYGGSEGKPIDVHVPQGIPEGSSYGSQDSPSHGSSGTPHYGPEQSDVQVPERGTNYGSQDSSGYGQYGGGDTKQQDLTQQPDIYGTQNGGSWRGGQDTPGTPQQDTYNTQGGINTYAPQKPQGPSTELTPQRNNYVKGYQQSPSLPAPGVSGTYSGSSNRGSTGSAPHRPATDFSQYPSGPTPTVPPYQPPIQKEVFPEPPAIVPPSHYVPEQPYKPSSEAPASSYDGSNSYNPATRTQQGSAQRPGTSAFYPNRDIPSGPDALPPAPPPSPISPITGQRPSVSSEDDHHHHHDGIKWLEVYGNPGQDFPIYSKVPQTDFRCSQEAYPGFYADEQAQCQVFHVCFGEGRQESFLCPNATIFNQRYFVCDWWQNVDCATSRSYYGLNANLYKEGQGPTSTEPPGGSPNMPTLTDRVPSKPAPPVQRPLITNYVPSTSTDQGSRTYDSQPAKPPAASPAYQPDGPGYTQVIEEALPGSQQGEYGAPGSPTYTQDRDANSGTFGSSQAGYGAVAGIPSSKPDYDYQKNQQSGHTDQAENSGGTIIQGVNKESFQRPEQSDTPVRNIHPAGPAKSADNFDIVQGNYEGFVTNQFVNKPQNPSGSQASGLPDPVKHSGFNQGSYGADQVQSSLPVQVSQTDKPFGQEYNAGHSDYGYGSTGTSTGTRYGSNNSGSSNYGSPGSRIVSSEYSSTKSGKPVGSTGYVSGSTGPSDYGITESGESGYGSTGTKPSSYGSPGYNNQGYNSADTKPSGYGATGTGSSGTATGYDNNNPNAGSRGYSKLNTQNGSSGYGSVSGYTGYGSSSNRATGAGFSGATIGYDNNNPNAGSPGYSKPNKQTVSSEYGSVSGYTGYGSLSSGYSGYGSTGTIGTSTGVGQSGYTAGRSRYSNYGSGGAGSSGSSGQDSSVTGPAPLGYGTPGSGYKVYVSTNVGNFDEKKKEQSYNVGQKEAGSSEPGSYDSSAPSNGYGSSGSTGQGTGSTSYGSSMFTGYGSSGSPTGYVNPGSGFHGHSGSTSYGSSGSSGYSSSGSPGHVPSQLSASGYSNSGYNQGSSFQKNPSQGTQEQVQQNYRKPDEGVSVHVSTGTGPFKFSPFQDSHSNSKSYVKGIAKPVPENLRFTSEDEPQPDEGAFEAPNTQNFNAPRPDAPGISSYGSQDSYEGSFKTPGSQILTVPRPNPEVQSYTNYNRQKPYDVNFSGRNSQIINVPRPVQGDVTKLANQHDSSYRGEQVQHFSVPRPHNAGYINSGYFEGSWSKPENQQGSWQAIQGYQQNRGKGGDSQTREHQQQTRGEQKQRKYGYGK